MPIVTSLAVAAFVSVASAQSAAACPPTEGPAVAGPWGLTVCDRPARVPVVMYDDAQPGVRVLTVVADGPLARAGLAAGDVIYQVAGVRVTTGKEAVAAFGDTSNAKGLTVNFWRDRKPYLVRVWAEP